MSRDARVHTALTGEASGLVCVHPGCGRLLTADAEICDECGGTRLIPLGELRAMLCGWADDREVVFGLRPDRPVIVGRANGNAPEPDIDLRRLPGSGTVHHRHVRVENGKSAWRVTQLGTNRVLVLGRRTVELPTGATVELQHGDTLDIAGVPLTFALRARI